MRTRKNRTGSAVKSTKSCRIVLVTAPDLKIARKMAQAALRQRLVACANIIPGLESHYWWEKKTERSREVLVLFKTTRARLMHLQTMVLEMHPYTTPEFVSLNVDKVSRDYLNWWIQNTL